ncbi:MAG: magnesium transporter CorA family protein [Chitinophagales bacterium]|nr:magnesium transporter CorA family protein [Chitinophagales bacterium]
MRSFIKSSNGFYNCDYWEPNCWVNIECPTVSDKEYLINDLKVPESYFNDIEDVDERPRIEFENGWFLIIMRVPFKSEDYSLPFSTVPLGLIFKGDIFVSICFYQTEMIPDFINYVNRKGTNVRNHFDLVLKLLLSSSVWFLKYLKQINLRIKLAENQLEKSIKNEELQALLKIEKCMVYFITSLKGNDILIYKIKNIKEHRDTYDTELVEDVEIELRQALETTNIYSNILSGMMDAYASVISNNLNVMMKQLTSVSIVLMIPTLVASLYGMNVPNSFGNNEWGFWIVLLISFLFAATVILLFRFKKWF